MFISHKYQKPTQEQSPESQEAKKPARKKAVKDDAQ